MSDLASFSAVLADRHHIERESASPVDARPSRLFTAIVAAGVVAALGVGWWATHRATLVPGRVLVLPFENKTGDGALDDYGARLAEAITDQVGRVGVGEVVATATVRGLVGRRTTPSTLARDISRRTGAGLVVRGAYYRAQQGVEVRTEGLRMPSQEQRFTFSVQGPVTSDSLLLTVARRTAVALTLEAAQTAWNPLVAPPQHVSLAGRALHSEPR